MKHDVRKIRTDGKKEDKKYDFLFAIGYNNVLALSDMNPLRVKKFKELDANTQNNIKRIDEAIERSSTRLKEIKSCEEDTRQKLDDALSSQIKKFGIELKDVSERIRALSDFVKRTSEEFDFCRLAVKSYEEVLAKLKTDQRLNADIPSASLLALDVFLCEKVRGIKFAVADLLDTIKDVEDVDMRVENSAAVYEHLMSECEIAFGDLLQKSHDVLYMVRKARARFVGGQRTRAEQPGRRIEEERTTGGGASEDLVRRRLDKVISGFNN